MARSRGYRPRVEQRAGVAKLRARLAECDSSQWQRASIIMREIAALLGHNQGPSGGQIEPRACKYCHKYGHTRQHCAVRRAGQESEDQRVIDEHKAERDRARRVTVTVQGPTQAQILDCMRLPYTLDPILGPMLTSAREGEGEGEWCYRAGQVVRRVP